MTLTADRVRAALDYAPETGVFHRKETSRNNRVRAGEVAGHLSPQGYRLIGLDGTQHLAHRLAWLYIHGSWPVNRIDHRNEDKDDNRIANLREASDAQNQQNHSRPRRDNRSGFRGVHQRGNRWIAAIWLAGVRNYLGSFDTADEAARAYLAAKREIHPFWDGSGRYDNVEIVTDDGKLELVR